MTARGERCIRHLGRSDREAEEAPHGRELARDRRGSELARARAAELRHVVRQDADVDVADAQVAVVEPAPERLDVAAIDTARRLAEPRRFEKTIDPRLL